MKSKNEIQASVINIMKQRYENPTSFEQVFAPQMLELGISRLVFDAFTNDMHFYTKTDFICSFHVDFEKDHQTPYWIQGKSFCISDVKNTIEKFDSGQISWIQFHKEIFEAGVVSCLVYFDIKKIYYMGKDGNYYLENY